MELLRSLLPFCLLICQGASIQWRYHNGKGYLLVTEKMDWYNAQVVCRSIGGRLAHVFSESENNFLKLLTDRTSLVWLGGADIHREADWSWYNPVTPMNFTNWSPTNGGQPNNGRYSNCLTFWKSISGYMWADEPCGLRKYQFICERYGMESSTDSKQLAVAVPDSEIQWQHHNDKDFVLVPEKLDWFDAQIVCSSIGGRLAHVTSESDNNFLMSLTDQTNLVWLGGSDLHKECDWSWYNPITAMNFTFWSPTGPQPNNGRVSNCLAYWKSVSGYMWADEPCGDRKYQFICESYTNCCQLELK